MRIKERVCIMTKNKNRAKSMEWTKKESRANPVGPKSNT